MLFDSTYRIGVFPLKFRENTKKSEVRVTLGVTPTMQLQRNSAPWSKVNQRPSNAKYPDSNRVGSILACFPYLRGRERNSVS